MIGRALLERRAEVFPPTSQTSYGSSRAIPGNVNDQVVDWLGEHDGLAVPAWWSGVRIISSTVAMVPCEVKLRTDENVVYPARKSRLWRLLGVSANPENSAGQLWEFVILSLLLRGNAYIWKERDRDGRVIALWPIRAGRVLVGRDPDTKRKVYWISTGHEDADFAPLKSADILHIRGPGDDALVGWSPIRFQRDLLMRSASEGEYQQSQLNNGVRPSGVLSTDGKLSSEAASKLKQRWDSVHGGGRNAGGTVVLEDGLSWTQVSLSAADAQFLQTRQFSRQEIAMILDLPAHRLLAGEGGGMHYSSSQMDIKAFGQQTIAPWTSRIERALLQDPDFAWTYTGQKSGSLFPKFDLDALSDADPTERYANHRTSLEWRTRNEIRGDEGLPPVKGGDVLAPPKTSDPAPPSQGTSA